LDFLADYILNTHHTYVRKNLPDLVAYAKKVAEVHGSQHPELHKIKTLVDEVNAELTSHMVTEEEVLFPAVKQLVLAHKNGQKIDTRELEKNIKLLENEHEIVGKSMAEMRDLSNNYTLPSDSCASYALLFKMLDEFENDLHLHIHLENNILFKKAILIGKN
nr:hemerythrin domain-containing protein [Bacteroidia bacterium]